MYKYTYLYIYISIYMYRILKPSSFPKCPWTTQ